MSSSQLFCLIVLVGLVSVGNACNITLKVKSSTKKPFQIQIYIPALHQKTERVEFQGHGEKKVYVNGKDCMAKKWIFKTWKVGPNNKWVPASQASGKLEGVGTFRLVVEDNLMPYGFDRMGVACMESDGLICG